MPKRGNLSEFNADTEDDWPSYIEQMNLYFICIFENMNDALHSIVKYTKILLSTNEISYFLEMFPHASFPYKKYNSL